MAETTFDFRIAARTRFGDGADISGSGSFAAVIRCARSPVIRLFDTWSMARTLCGYRCTAETCNSRHDVIKLERPAPRPVLVFSEYHERSRA